MSYELLRQVFIVMLSIAVGVMLMLFVKQERTYDNMLVTNSKGQVLVLKHTIFGSYKVSDIEIEMIGE